VVTFRFLVDRTEHAFFDASVTVEVGDGAWALFWEDNWLAGCSIKHLASNLWVAVLPRIKHSRTVKDGVKLGVYAGCRYYACSYSIGSRPIPYCLGSCARRETDVGA
jgi:hypothetical protein